MDFWFKNGPVFLLKNLVILQCLIFNIIHKKHNPGDIQKNQNYRFALSFTIPVVPNYIKPDSTFFFTY